MIMEPAYDPSLHKLAYLTNSYLKTQITKQSNWETKKQWHLIPPLVLMSSLFLVDKDTLLSHVAFFLALLA